MGCVQETDWADGGVAGADGVGGSSSGPKDGVWSQRSGWAKCEQGRGMHGQENAEVGPAQSVRMVFDKDNPQSSVASGNPWTLAQAHLAAECLQ